ncbi:MAG TPA: hypothetical protein VI758_01135 [Bacteroidota bacterium]
MKNQLLLIVSLFLLMVLGGSTTLAQQSNSASQIVVFGVNRSAVAKIIAAIPATYSNSTRSISRSTMLNGQSPEMPLKITYSKVSSGKIDKPHADLAVIGTPREDLSSNSRSAHRRSSSAAPLIVTITE